MTKFIKLRGINSQNAANDFELHIRPVEVRYIHTATPVDRNMRKEINAVVHTPTGAYAVGENPATIRTMIENAESDIPSTEEE